MLSPWEFVRPRYWCPMSSLEQSMMDLEHMDDRMLRSRFPFRDEMQVAPSTTEDDDFFSDLPVTARDTAQRLDTQHAPADADCQRAFSSYSFSNSSVVDDKGRRVVSTRRRYEDSTGRLKAVHERQIDCDTLRSVWSRQTKDDAGTHESTCSSGTPDDFERAWQATPFGEAQKKTITAPREDEEQPQDPLSTTEPMDFVDVPTRQAKDEQKQKQQQSEE